MRVIYVPIIYDILLLFYLIKIFIDKIYFKKLGLPKKKFLVTPLDIPGFHFLEV